eukprot:17209-Heterococcus_DN1.PRE.2
MDKAIENFVAALQMNSEYEKAKSWHAKVLQEQAVLRANANSNSAATTSADTTATSSNSNKPTDSVTATNTSAANSANGTGDSSSSASIAVSGTATSASSSGTVSDDVIINTVPLTPETTNGLKKAHYDESDTAQA